MDTVDVVGLISRWVHLLSVIAVVGGAIFQRFALHPALTAARPAGSNDNLVDAIRGRWARFVHASIALLLLSGGFNFYRLVLTKDVAPLPYHAIFGVKLLLALTVFFVASALVSRGRGFAGIRARRATWLSVAVVLAVLIVLISGALAQIRTAPLDAAIPV